jgi:hypothetical protein
MGRETVAYRLYWPTLGSTAPSLPAFFSESASLVPARSEQLGGFVALLVAHADDSGISLAGLHQFTRGAKPEARRAFAPRDAPTLGRARYRRTTALVAGHTSSVLARPPHRRYPSPSMQLKWRR